VYVQYHDEFSRAAVRLVSPIAVAVIAAMVAAIYTFGPRLHAKYTLVNHSDHLDGTEMVAMASSESQNAGDSAVEKSCIDVVEVAGRPSLPDVMKPPIGARTLGVFSCGPASLMWEVRSTVQALTGRQLCCGGIGKPCKISIYEESFET
jgi:hypothetical protein